MQTLERIGKYDALNKRNGARNTDNFLCDGKKFKLTHRQYRRVNKKNVHAIQWERRLENFGGYVVRALMNGSW